MKKIIILFTMLMLNGCATCYVRCAPEPAILYPATRVDIFATCALWDEDMLPGLWFLSPLPIIDIVPSLITDTVCLPYDVYKINKKDK